MNLKLYINLDFHVNNLLKLRNRITKLGVKMLQNSAIYSKAFQYILL
jgi:hypothetical protein